MEDYVDHVAFLQQKDSIAGGQKLPATFLDTKKVTRDYPTVAEGPCLLPQTTTGTCTSITAA